MEINIALIEPIGGHGGNDIYAFNIIHSIGMSENCSATLYTCDATATDGRENVKLTYKNIFGKTNKFIRGFNYMMGTIKSLIDAKKNKANIVHLHFFDFSMREYFNLFMAKKLFGFHVVGTVHDVESFEKHAKGDNSKHNYDKFFLLLDGVVVHTEYARRELLKHLSSETIGGRNIQTIYACDLNYDSLGKENVEKGIARKRLNLPQERKIVLFFGQIKTVKGLDVLLEAVANVSQKEPSILLVIAGKVWKDDFSKYERIIRENGSEPYVDQRIGFIDNEEVPYYFNAADVVALPYKKIYNSGVLIRAMSFGTPVLASNFGPFKEFIHDGENGFLFETENAESLAEKLFNVLEEETPLESVSRAETEFIKRNFSLKKIGNQYRELYQSILVERA